MPKYGGSLRRAIEDNQQRECKVKGCFNHRWRVSGYCLRHSKANQNWGHPLGADVPNQILTTGFDQLEKVIQANPNHKGLALGVAFFDKWIATACATAMMSPPMVPAVRHMTRLYDANVHPIDCIKVVASVWLLSSRGSRFIKSDLHCRCIMGQKLFSLAPMRKGEHGKRGKERKAAGLYIQENIGVLLVSLADAVERLEQREQERIKAMGSKFEI
ncbi:hypothetical protein [uncultured Desulfosarcina sp.]|uniref:hypothetical protein n=1 Tax=uncultured Desulfosarcina sp. TaxID=218289 RepID=UPI0029C8BA41|nr:hypothetical protein [uncultured Desulfosarcina sp.]